MKLLIAYDGSDCADRALDGLKRAGLPSELEALVVTAKDVYLPPPPPEYQHVLHTHTSRRVAAAIAQAQYQASSALEEAEPVAKRAKDYLESEHPNWNTDMKVITGKAEWAIVETASVWGADLIVVGSHGRSILGRIFLGSVSKAVATEAECSVHVSRCQPKNGERPIQIVIGFDNSPHSQRIIQALSNRSFPPGTKATIIAVEEYPRPISISGVLPVATSMIENAIERNRRELIEGVETASEDLAAVTGLNIDYEIKQGDARQTLIDEAQRLKADYIMVGSRGIGSKLKRLMLGSVSTGLINNAPCSVEIVR
jgi:nucleotide-binding universal stress UspA family protein